MEPASSSLLRGTEKLKGSLQHVSPGNSHQFPGVTASPCFTLELGAMSCSVFFQSQSLPRLVHRTLQLDGQLLGVVKGSNKTLDTNAQQSLIPAGNGLLAG